MDQSDLIERIETLGDRMIGRPERIPEVVPQLLALLRNSESPAILAAIAQAIKQAWNEHASLQLLALVAHSDVEVRRAVAETLPCGIESTEAKVRVAEALVRLCRDDDEDVRDWATFGLGRQLQIDTSAVRELLWLLTTDKSRSVRDEALVGVARRRDRRSLDLVVQRLAGSDVKQLVFEAAEYLADPNLLPLLAGWRTHGSDDYRDEVERAFRACDPAYRRARLELYPRVLVAVQQFLTERGHPEMAALFCDRFANDVELMLDVDPDYSWNVDVQLELAENNPRVPHDS